MIPLQDIVPSGRTPLATLMLIGLDVAGWLLQGAATPLVWTPFAHVSGVHLALNLLFLWLFGDNVEARIGRVLFVAVYVGGGVAVTLLASALTSGAPPAVGAAGAVSAVLGAYFVLLPKSRVLVLVPAPPVLPEVPASVFLILWWFVHLATALATPQTVVDGTRAALLWPLLVSFGQGAAVAAVVRKPVAW